MTEEQLLQQLGYGGWQVISRTQTGDEYVANPQDEFGPKVANQRRQEKWVITDGKGGRQTITVQPSLGRGGQTVANHYDVIDAPNATSPKPASEGQQPAKGTRRIVQEGGRWVQQVVVDDKGTWSVETGEDGKPVSVAIEKPATTTTDTSPTTKTVNGHTFQFNPATNTWDQAQGLPTEVKESPAATVNTTAEYIPNPRDPSSFIKNPNYRTPDQQLTTGQQAVDAATAGTAQSAADAALKKAQADAATAQQNLQNAITDARQKPTDQQAQQAIQNALQQQQLAIQQLQAAISQSANLNPIAVQQAQATLAQSHQAVVTAQENIKQAKLGTLYGRPEQQQQIRDLIASGDLTKDEADGMMTALNRGTTVYQALQQTQADRSTSRGQDINSRNQLASSFTSMFNSGLGTIADMNKYAQPGSSGGADAFMALLNMAQDRLKSYAAPEAPTTDYLGPLGGARPSPVGAMVNAVPPAATTTAPSAQPITINIGSGAASNPQPPSPSAPLLPPGVAGTGADPRIGGMVEQAKAQVPATMGDVLSMGGPAFAKYLGLQRSSGPQVA